MSKTLYTSDWHFGHVNILNHCPQRREFLGLSATADVNDMNDALVALWNDQVAPDDTVWVVGDMCMGKVQETIKHVARLNGTKYLVLGNHDRPHPVATKSSEKRAEWEHIYGEYFEDMVLSIDINFDGFDIEVNHFPFPGNDHVTGGERYNSHDIVEWSPVDKGQPLVHGHVHDLYKTRGRMLNLGIDAWHRMLSGEEIGSYFRSQGFA